MLFSLLCLSDLSVCLCLSSLVRVSCSSSLGPVLRTRKSSDPPVRASPSWKLITGGRGASADRPRGEWKLAARGVRLCCHGHHLQLPPTAGILHFCSTLGLAWEAFLSKRARQQARTKTQDGLQESKFAHERHPSVSSTRKFSVSALVSVWNSAGRVNFARRTGLELAGSFWPAEALERDVWLPVQIEKSTLYWCLSIFVVGFWLVVVCPGG